jgi:hypothetical protein
MKISKSLLFISFIALVFFLTASSSARVGPTYAIVNCKIIPVSGPPIENGVIIIRDGLIESLGPKEKIYVPEDAEVIKADSLFAYPGLIDIHTNLFLEPAKEEPQRPGATEAMAAEPQAPDWAKQVDSSAFQLIKPKKSDIENFQKIGITTVLVVPEKGIYAGQSVLLNINGDKKETMVIKNPVALHINFTTERRVYPSSLMGTIALLRQSFLDTEYYSSYKSQFSKSSRGQKRPEYDPFLETLSQFVIQKKPIFFNCQNQEDIKRALGLIEEFKLNGFITGANEAWRVPGLIKKAKVPLLVSLDFKPPFTSIYINQSEELKEKAEKEIYPANSVNLYKEGIKFALTSHGLKSSEVLENIQKAIKAGLPVEEVLRAMTIIPAGYLGVSDILGSLEPGKIANLILTSGEIFGEKTKVERVFVDGLSFEIKQPPKEAKPSALNAAGKWKAAISGPMGEMEMTVELMQEGNAITGNISTEMGKWEISDGLLGGNELTFTISATIMGEKMEIAFSGTAQKDSIEGILSFSGGSAKLKATRIPDMDL